MAIHPRPRMFYIVTHQARHGIDDIDYTRINLEFHREFAEACDRALEDTSAHPSSASADSTPLRPTASRSPSGLLHSAEFRTTPLNEESRRRHASLGFDASRPVHESLFVFEGSENLDFLEHIVRDRLRIYEGAHGRRLAMLEHAAYLLANVIYPKDGGAQPPRPSTCDVVVDLEKPGRAGETTYADFRHDLFEKCRAVAAAIEGSEVMVSQRKLGLSSTGHAEFSVRVRSHTPDDVDSGLKRPFGTGLAVRRSEFLG